MPARALVLLALLAASTTVRAETFACSIFSIRVFADEAGTTAAPIRILGGPNSVTECYGIALDREHRELIVAQGNVSTFAMEAQNDTPPLRTMPVFPDLGFASAVAVDLLADEIVAGTADGRIHVFARTATSGPPKRTIDAPASGVGPIYGIAVDRSRDEIVVSAFTNSGPAVVSFARTATGAASPVRPPTATGAPGSIAIDAGSDELYVVSGNTIVVMRAGAVLRTFSSGYLESPIGIARRADGQVLVSDRISGDPDPIKRFAATPSGGVPPVSFILAGSAPGTTIWGIASTREPDCASGNVSRCLFRDGFEQLPD